MTPIGIWATTPVTPVSVVKVLPVYAIIFHIASTYFGSPGDAVCSLDVSHDIVLALAAAIAVVHPDQF